MSRPLVAVIIKRLRVQLRTATWLCSFGLIGLVFGASALRSMGLFDLDAASFDADQIAHQETSGRIAQTYSQLVVAVDRKPAPLRLLIRGADDAFASCVVLHARFQSTTFRARQTLPAYAFGSFSFDPARVIALLGSLLALLLTTGAVAREREQGTLQVTLSYPCRRSTLLLGEYAAALVTILIPVILSLSLLVVFASVTGRIALDRDLLVPLVLFVATLVLVLSVSVSAGLLISVSVRNASTALTMGFGAWVLFGVVYPAMTPSLASLVRPVDSAVANPAGAHTLMEYAARSNNAQRGASEPRDQEREILQRITQADVHRSWSILSPYSLFVRGAEASAGTGLDGCRGFLSLVNRSESQFRRWQDDMLARYPARATTYTMGDPPLDLDGLPSNQVVRPTAQTDEAARAMLMLAVWNVVIISIAYRRFERYDARV
jgi:ABC-type transport system involved in multi-copper enzyme maturation permease subunit